MTEQPFVHLHCHTHYSLLDGASRIPELVALTKSLGMNAISITDHGNLFGAIEFYKECSAAGINPIVGYEAYVSPGKRFEREAKRRGEAGFHLTLLAQNLTGFKNLVKMSSVAYTEGYHYVPRIDKDLLEAHKEGIICLSGCASSEFSEFILKEQLDEAAELAGWFANIFAKNFYVEIQNNGLDIQTPLRGRCDRRRQSSWAPPGCDLRCPLLEARRQLPARYLAVHQYGQDAQGREPHALWQRSVLRRAAGGNVQAVSRSGGGGPAQPGNRQRRGHQARFQGPPFPGLYSAGQEEAGKISARAVRAGHRSSAMAPPQGRRRRHGCRPPAPGSSTSWTSFAEWVLPAIS